MITKEQAKRQALLDGLREDQITDEVLKLYGYQVPQPTAGINTTPLMMDSDTEAALKRLDEERKKNQDLAAPVVSAIGKVLTFARTTGLIKWMLVVVLLLGMAGCRQDNTEARKTAKAVEANIISYQTKRDAFTERLIKYFRDSEHARIQLIYEAALKSVSTPRAVTVTKTVREDIVGADGKPAFREKQVEEIVQTNVVEENAVKALGKQRLRLIQQTETTVLLMRQQLKEIEMDAANAKTLLAGLDAYFAQRVTTLDAIEQAQSGVIDFLGNFLKDKEERSDPAAARLPELTRGSTP